MITKYSPPQSTVTQNYQLLLIINKYLMGQMSAMDLSSIYKVFYAFIRIMTTWANINLQARASPMIQQLVFFHDHALIIRTLVSYIKGSINFP
jgi:hypothetical protein